MSTLKAIGIALGKKGAIAAKVAIVTLGAGAATTGVVILNEQYQEDTQKVNQQEKQTLITSENRFDEEKAQLLLDLNELFESPIVEENAFVETATPIAKNTNVQEEEFIEPQITQLSSMPRIELPERPSPQESSIKEVEASSFSGEFSQDDIAYFNKYGLQRQVQPASFLGGQDELATYVSNNIQYPKDALQDGIEGLVEVGFTVDEEGNISDVHTIKGVNQSLNEEAERIVRNFPNWVPQQVNSEFVKSNVSIPIRFEIN